MRVRGVRATLAAAAVAALSLTGCGDAAPQAGSVDDSTPAAETTTEEPTEEPTTDEPTTDEPTEKHTSGANQESGGVEGAPDEVDDPEVKSAAKAFVQDFMDTYDEAAGTGEFDPVRAMYADSCDRCKDNVSWFTGVYGDGGRVEGGGFTDPQLVVAGTTADTVFVEVSSTIAAFDVYDSGGDVAESQQAAPSQSTFGIRKDDDGAWQVVSWAEEN